MQNLDLSDSVGQFLLDTWRLWAAVVAVVLLAGLGYGVWKDRSAKQEMSATNMLFGVQQILAAEKKSPADAALLFAPLLEKYPKSHGAYEARLKIGDLWMDNGQPVEAIKYYDQAAQSANDSFSQLMAFYNLGSAQEASDQCPAAITSFQKAKDIKGSDFLHAELLLALGRCQEKLGQVENARSSYREVQNRFSSKSYYPTAAAAFEKALGNAGVKAQ
jgi:TolA-binding protein